MSKNLRLEIEVPGFYASDNGQNFDKGCGIWR